jgi:hypothetical protein
MHPKKRLDFTSSLAYTKSGRKVIFKREMSTMMAKYEIRFFALSLMLGFLLWAGTFHAFPCFNPTDFFATEVVLNRPGISYSLEPIKRADNVSVKEGAFVYRSHFDDRIAVLLKEIEEGALKGLSLRIQIPTRVERDDLVEAVDVKKEEFDFKSAVKVELEWLKANGVIRGIEGRDIAEISQVVKAGRAGWNSRIVFERRWLPYNETENPMLLRDYNGGGCGGFDLGNMPDGKIMLSVTAISPRDKLATTWGRCKSR